MIELTLQPTGSLVACLAFTAVSFFVHIVFLVTILAFVAGLLFIGIFFMA